VDLLEAAVIGTGWCGGIRAETLARSALCRKLLSTMPGEQVDHVFAGQMEPETLHFLEAVMHDRAPMVSPESARAVMECYLAADLSAERGAPVELPPQGRGRIALAIRVRGEPHSH
jgi:hypothetical protein